MKVCNQRGVGLFEVIIAISIMFILAVTAISALQPYPAIRLSAAAETMATDIEYSHKLAVIERANHGIRIDPSSEQYFVYRQTTSNKVPSPVTGADLGIDYITSNEFKGVDVIGTNFGYQIEFNSKGEPRDQYGNLLTSEAVITLAHPAGYNTTIHIEPGTGKVTVQ
ncbi:MAG: hypothetical protein JW844_05235 [Candidatus Omnitrophica bacterium]|nr:hypothetical protein [Candidatus Omnitrophota bacterium]